MIMGDTLKGIMIFAGIFLIESIVAAVVISFFWNISLQHRFDLYLSFVDWLGIIWGFKLIRFNTMKIMQYSPPQQIIFKKDENEVQ